VFRIEKLFNRVIPGDFYTGYQQFIRHYKEELLIFSFVFIVVLASVRLPDAGYSAGNVEQWLNITNNTLYGQQDMLFSYGPLYWLTGQRVTPYNIYSYWMALVTISAVNALFWSVILTLSHRASAVIFFAVTYFLFIDGLMVRSSFMLWPFVLIAYLEFAHPVPLRPGYRAWALIGMVVGACFYVRFFFGVIGAVSLALYLFSTFLGSRKVLDLLGLFTGILTGYLLFGVLIFHTPASLVDYLFINNQLSFGNSVDMTYDVINTPRSFVLVALIVLGFNGFLVFKRRTLLLPINFMLLIFFKLGFSRTDHYLGYFVVPVAVLSLLLLFDRSRIGRAAFLVVTVSLFNLASVPGFPGARVMNKLTTSIDFNTPYAERVKQAYSVFTLDPGMVQRVGQSKIDVYPYNNEYLLANGLNYRHRPLFQSYMTLTPKLDAMNQRFFEAAERPAFMLWTAGAACGSPQCRVFDGFDNKYALNEDPLTSSTILMNYHVVQHGQGRNGIPLVLLQANDQVTHYALSVAPPMAMEFGKWYAVPRHAGGVIKLLPRLEFTVLGKIKNLLFRGSIVEISYRLKTAEVRKYRLNLLNAGSGIWVSPLLDHIDFVGEEVEAVMLSSNMHGYLKPSFQASWATLPLDSVSTRPVPYNPVVVPALAAGDEKPLACSASIDVANGEHPLPTTLHAQTSLYLRGWLARSTTEGTLFEQTLLTLTDAAGRRTFISTSPESRPDVATAFNNAGLAEAGFKSMLDLSAYKGTYTLGLAGISESRLYVCSQFAVPVTIP